MQIRLSWTIFCLLRSVERFRWWLADHANRRYIAFGGLLNGAVFLSIFRTSTTDDLICSWGRSNRLARRLSAPSISSLMSQARSIETQSSPGPLRDVHTRRSPSPLASRDSSYHQLGAPLHVARIYLYAAHADDAVVVAQRDGNHHRDDLNARRRGGSRPLLRGYCEIRATSSSRSGPSGPSRRPAEATSRSVTRPVPDTQFCTSETRRPGVDQGVEHDVGHIDGEATVHRFHAASAPLNRRRDAAPSATPSRRRGQPGARSSPHRRSAYRPVSPTYPAARSARSRRL